MGKNDRRDKRMNQTREFPLAHGYLDRARKAKIQVNMLKQRIMNLRMLTTDTSVHLTENRIQNDSADKNKLLTLTAQIDEMERELEETKEALENIRLEMTACATAVFCPEYRV